MLVISQQLAQQPKALQLQMLVISQQLAQQPKTPMFSLVTELVQRSQVKTQALSKNLDNRRHILSQRQPVWRREIQKPKRNNK
jgi:hypothetical protein